MHRIEIVAIYTKDDVNMYICNPIPSSYRNSNMMLTSTCTQDEQVKIRCIWTTLFPPLVTLTSHIPKWAIKENQGSRHRSRYMQVQTLKSDLISCPVKGCSNTYAISTGEADSSKIWCIWRHVITEINRLHKHGISNKQYYSLIFCYFSFIDTDFLIL
jgi:hypothetical protein